MLKEPGRPWVGDVNAGLQIRFYDNKYERPLNTNFYHQKPLHMPLSWCNNGNGGIDINNASDGTRINAYSGKREVKKGDKLYYYFNVAITPFRRSIRISNGANVIIIVMTLSKK